MDVPPQPLFPSRPDLRVLVIADDPLARAGLATLLASLPGVGVVGQMSGDTEVIAGLEVYRPDVVLWDFGWNPVPALPQRFPRHGVVSANTPTPFDRLAELYDAGGLSVVLLADEVYAGAAWMAGARGLLERNVAASTLRAALHTVGEGLIVLAPAFVAAVMPGRLAEPAAGAGGLTPRELEVLQLVAEGLPNKTIAHRLRISEHTVKFHLNALMGKLGAQSRTEAVVRATRLGLLLL